MAEVMPYRLLDMHSQEVCRLDDAGARDLLKHGYARTYSSRSSSRILGLILTVPLSTINGGESPAKALSINNYTGTRYVFREKLSTPKVNAFTFRFKKIDEMERSEVVLARLMRQPAEEAPVYQLRSEKPCPDTKPAAVSPRTCSGSRASRARSVVEMRRSISQSMRPILERAA